MPAIPECPVTEAEREWLESRMAWLGEKLGTDRMVWATVPLPSDEFFPEDYEGSQADARVLLDTMCEFIGLAPDTVELFFFDARAPARDADDGAGGARAGASGRISHRLQIDVAH